MNNILVKILATALLAAFIQLFSPWWGIAVAGLISGLLFGGKSINAFLAGFIGIAILWGSYAFWVDHSTASILSEKVSKIVMLPNAFSLLLVTAIIGGVVGGMSCLTGTLFRNSFK
ncbi:hypothetical protein V6R21_19605 [Limibacter armeniacum]|uniref:hypothetical protein n=1 Tax=Limibacter armeniacum TaxID=466084 RepID=UPI002FE64D91